MSIYASLGGFIMEKVLIAYWSGTGNTEIMADSIEEGCLMQGADVTKVSVSEQPSIEGYDRLILGCSSMGDEVLEESEFAPWYDSIKNELSSKKVALFGSYGWGDGQWMRDWDEEVSMLGANNFEPSLIINYTPDELGKTQCVEFGKDFMSF